MVPVIQLVNQLILKLRAPFLPIMNGVFLPLVTRIFQCLDSFAFVDSQQEVSVGNVTIS